VTKDFYFNTADALGKAKADRDKPVTPVEYKPVISDVGSDSNMLWPDKPFVPKGTGKLTLHNAAPVQEPVALDVTLDGEEAKLLRDMLGDDRDELSPVRLLVGNGHSGHGLYAAHAEYQEEGAVLLAATPPAAQRQWVGLTDEEFEDIELGCRSTSFGKIEAMQKVEAKLKEKNNG
jgi:hypothetical protein